MDAVEFFWDPVCPFAWVTSRWVVEVAEQRPLAIRWRPISLRLLNEGRYDEDPRMGAKLEGHTTGLELLRVAMAVEEGHGNAAMGQLYTALGRAIHLRPEGQALAPDGSQVLAEKALAESGLPTALALVVEDESRDAEIRSSTDLALERVGPDIGTPVLTFGPPHGPSFFGPVISRAPRGPEAVVLWEALETIARHRGFSEIKRSMNEPLQPAS